MDITYVMLYVESLCLQANWFWKLKQWKIDARRRQWIYQCIIFFFFFSFFLINFMNVVDDELFVKNGQGRELT